MIISIPAVSDNIEEFPAKFFARGEGFLIIDTDSGQYWWIPNPIQANKGHVGPDVVNKMVELGVTRIIAHKFGPNVAYLLHKNQIEYVISDGEQVPVKVYIERIEKEFGVKLEKKTGHEIINIRHQ